MGRPRGAGVKPPAEPTDPLAFEPSPAQLAEGRKVAGELIEQARSTSPLALHAGFYSGFSDALKMIAERLPPRSTIRQAYAFLLIVTANAAGQTVTAKRLRDIGGTGPDGAEVLGQAIQKTYQILLDSSPYEPDGVGWVMTQVDPSDRRNNFLLLTPEGERIATEIRKTLERN